MKRMQNEFEMVLSNLKICARIDARTYAHSRVFVTDIDWTNIDLDHDKYEWGKTFCYEDMIMSWFSQNGA